MFQLVLPYICTKSTVTVVTYCTSGILLQFPFYAGIMSLMAAVNPVTDISLASAAAAMGIEPGRGGTFYPVQLKNPSCKSLLSMLYF